MFDKYLEKESFNSEDVAFISKHIDTAPKALLERLGLAELVVKEEEVAEVKEEVEKPVRRRRTI